MKLVAPISKVEEVLPIIEAGADELYCGVLPLEWYKKYTNLKIRAVKLFRVISK